MVAPRPIRGFSTIEILITMAILAVVITQILGVIGNQQENLAVHQDVLETQEDSRLVADLMLGDLRMAGFMVPKTAGISSVDGGNAAPDRICVSDAAGIDTGSLDTNGRFDGARVSATVGAGATSLDLVVADLDIDGDSTVDFAEDAGIIISDGTASHCARITAIDSGTGDVSFTPATPGTSFPVGTGATRVVPAIVYEVTANGLERNGIVFARQVEDLQLEYDVDETFPVHVLNGQDTGAVATVRLSVVVRTERDDIGVLAGQRPALANRTAGPADTFRRRVVTNMISPRNFL